MQKEKYKVSPSKVQREHAHEVENIRISFTVWDGLYRKRGILRW